MIGRTYLEAGHPVTVLARWSGKGPRNVLIARADGRQIVRPFRGLCRDRYHDPRIPERACDHCGRPYTGPAVYCSFDCAVSDA